MSWHYIYITTNKINGKKYLGQRKCDLEKMETDKYFGSGTLLLRALKKYGRENFNKQIIYKCEGRKNIDISEINYIKKYRCLENRDIWYNRAVGGQRWRQEGHSEATSKSMKKFYSDPRNRVKPLATKLGISVDECYLMQTRKKLIKTLKKVRTIKSREELKIQTRIKKDLDNKKRQEYFNSEEYKSKRHKELKERGKRLSNSEDFKRKVEEGKRKALKKNPDLYKGQKRSIEHKIILAKDRIGHKSTYLHHMFWDKNMTFGMLSKSFYYKFTNFVNGKNKNDYSPERIKYIHEELLKLGFNCTYKQLEEHAISVKKESYKRERR